MQFKVPSTICSYWDGDPDMCDVLWNEQSTSLHAQATPALQNSSILALLSQQPTLPMPQTGDVMQQCPVNTSAATRMEGANSQQTPALPNLATCPGHNHTFAGVGSTCAAGRT